MSTVLSTIANALIEFILSLLRDPALAEQFDTDPEGTLAANGMQNVTYDDLCAVLPMVYDHPQVVQTVAPAALSQTTPSGGIAPHNVDVIRELQNVVTSNSYITNNSTLVDQSVNQNIWAQGDVMQMFDNDAVLATGEGSTAVGGDVVDDDSTDSSTTITAGGDAVVDNQLAVSTVDGSYNQTSDASTTDASTTTTLTGVELADTSGAGAEHASAAQPASSTQPASATEPASPAQPASDTPVSTTTADPEPLATYDDPADITDDADAGVLPGPDDTEDVYADDEY